VLGQLELFNVPRNADLNLCASLRSQLGCDWLIVPSDIFTVKGVTTVHVETMNGASKTTRLNRKIPNPTLSIQHYDNVILF